MSTEKAKPSHKLISANKVEGTHVYNQAGEQIGRVQDLMIDKASGTVTYAIMSFDGFLGMHAKHHPIPWAMLKYDADKDGYVADITEEQLHGAPSYDPTHTVDYSGEELYNRVYDHYEIQPNWAGA